MQGRIGTNSLHGLSANMWISGAISSSQTTRFGTHFFFVPTDGVGLQDLLRHEYQGLSLDCPYDVARFPERCL